MPQLLSQDPPHCSKAPVKYFGHNTSQGCSHQKYFRHFRHQRSLLATCSRQLRQLWEWLNRWSESAEKAPKTRICSEKFSFYYSRQFIECKSSISHFIFRTKAASGRFTSNTLTLMSTRVAVSRKGSTKTIPRLGVKISIIKVKDTMGNEFCQRHSRPRGNFF